MGRSPVLKSHAFILATTSSFRCPFPFRAPPTEAPARLSAPPRCPPVGQESARQAWPLATNTVSTCEAARWTELDLCPALDAPGEKKAVAAKLWEGEGPRMSIGSIGTRKKDKRRDPWHGLPTSSSPWWPSPASSTWCSRSRWWRAGCAFPYGRAPWRACSPVGWRLCSGGKGIGEPPALAQPDRTSLRGDRPRGLQEPGPGQRTA